MPQFKKLRLILGDQLNENHSWFKSPEKDVTYLMMEVRQETDYVKHHIQKVAAFFAAMRAFAERISLLGHHIIYLKLDDSRNRQNLADNITDLLRKIKPEYFWLGTSESSLPLSKLLLRDFKSDRTSFIF